MKKESTEGKPEAIPRKQKSKMIVWRMDALRYDDRDFMKELIKDLKSKRQ